HIQLSCLHRNPSASDAPKTTNYNKTEKQQTAVSTLHLHGVQLAQVGSNLPSPSHLPDTPAPNCQPAQPRYSCSQTTCRLQDPKCSSLLHGQTKKPSETKQILYLNQITIQINNVCAVLPDLNFAATGNLHL